MIHRGNYEGVSIGYFAGWKAPTSDAVNIGFAAGGNRNLGANVSSVNIGRHAGYAASGGNDVMIGHGAGQYAIDSSCSVLIGYLAGRNPNQASDVHLFDSIVIGHEAGGQVTGGQASVIIGSFSARNACIAHGAVIVGEYTGYNAANASDSVLIGQYAGYDCAAGSTLLIETNWAFRNTGLIYGNFQTRLLELRAKSLGFFDSPAVTKPTVTGSIADGTATASLVLALKQLGLITDSTTP